MTRKDFELIASVIRYAGATVDERYPDDHHGNWERERIGVLQVALEFASRLSSTNDRFDRERFLKACGVK